MENASKALLMAVSILVGILIISLIVTLFISSKDVTNNYDKTKQTEAIQQFNTNFTKYLGKELTIHQVITICNFASNNTTKTVSVIDGYSYSNIKDDVEIYSTTIKKYKLKIELYDNGGYISKISFY